MTRNLKALVLTLLAAGTMGAMTATAAQAAPELTAFETPKKYVLAILDGKQIGQHEFKPGVGGAVKCTTANFAGLMKTGTATAVTLEPTYHGCTYAGNFVTHVATNGCAYVLNTFEKKAEDEYKAQAGVECPPKATMNFFLTNLVQTAFICRVSIGPQSGLKTVDINNSTSASPPDIEVEMTVKGIKYETETLGGIGCGVPNGTYTDGEYVGNTTVQATNEAKTLIDLEMSG